MIWRRVFTGVLSTALLLSFGMWGGARHAASAGLKSESTKRFVPGRVLVRFRDDVSSFRAYQAIAESNASSRAELSGINTHVVEVPGVGREEEYLKHFLARPEV